MKKEEILSKARKEGMLGVDDGTKHMRNRGRITAQIMFFSVFFVIVLLAIVTKHKIADEVRALFLSYVAGETYTQWKFTKNKFMLYFAIVLGFSAVLALVDVVCSMYGITL